MNLQETLKKVHFILEKASIDHVLIGGLGLSCYGSTRATQDLDLLIYEKDKDRVKEILKENAFQLSFESEEVMHFEGEGLVDFLISRRPISKEMIKNAKKSGGPEGIHFARAEDIIGLKIQAYKNNPSRVFQDKADIQYLIKSQDDLDWDIIKEYADLFGEWEAIVEIKNS